MLGQLPIERVTPGPIFDKVGVDYAGPVLINLRTVLTHSQEFFDLTGSSNEVGAVIAPHREMNLRRQAMIGRDGPPYRASTREVEFTINLVIYCVAHRGLGLVHFLR